MTKIQENEILIYQAPNGAIDVHISEDLDTLFLTQQQVGKLFGVQKAAISKHASNIFATWELDKEATVSILETVQKEGDREVKRQREYYNLDLIISIWYRVNSKNATQFRQRATKTLKQHITQGFTINPKRIEKHYEQFLKAVEEVKQLSIGKDIDSSDILELIKAFAGTWFSLDSFDKQTTLSLDQTQETIDIQSEELYKDILQLKKELIEKGQATELFAQEKQEGNFWWIFANVFQTAFGEDVYPSIESKAAHLMYFIIKNHPFTDGNKRSGAFSFIWFLQKAGYDFRGKITPEALTALTLLIATSDPKDKEKIVELVILLLVWN